MGKCRSLYVPTARGQTCFARSPKAGAQGTCQVGTCRNQKQFLEWFYHFSNSKLSWKNSKPHFTSEHLFYSFIWFVFSVEFELRDGVPLSFLCHASSSRNPALIWGAIEESRAGFCVPSLAGFARVSWWVNSFVLGCSLQPEGLCTCVHSFMSSRICGSVGFQVSLTLPCGWETLCSFPSLFHGLKIRGLWLLSSFPNKETEVQIDGEACPGSHN